MPPSPHDLQSGCLHCPLAPFRVDFPAIKHLYQRDSDKIIAKEKEGHVIKCPNLREPWTPCDILFVADAPDGFDDRFGAPLAKGKNAGLLRDTIGAFLGHPIEKCGFATLIRCRTPRNKDPNKTDIRSCGPDLIAEIKARKPRLVVTLGNRAMDFLTGQSGITNMNGRFLKSNHPLLPGIDVMGCMSPGYVLFMDAELERFAEAIERAGKFLSGTLEQKMGKGEYFVLDTLADVEELFARFLEEGRTVAFDTETGSLTPFQDKFPRLLCFSFSNLRGTGYCIPFDHPESPWRVGGEKERERKKLIQILIKFILNPIVDRTGQNEKFDRQHIKAALNIDLPLTNRDTMMIHLVINERRGTHGLDMLAYEFTGMGGYHKELEDYVDSHKNCNPKEGGSYANIPGSILFLYACMDADVTWRVDDEIKTLPEYATNAKFRNLAEKFFPALSDCLGDIEYAGAQIDPSTVDRLDSMLTKQMQVELEKLHNLPVIRQYVADMQATDKGPDFEFNPGSVQQLRSVLFDYYKLRPVELTDTGFDRMLERWKKQKGLGDDAAAPKGKVLTFDQLVTAAIENKEWDLFSTNAEVLHEYDRDKNPLAGTVIKYREAETLHGTFVVPLKDYLDGNGRIHGSFWIHGTVTGRLSSSNPNLQNLPNKGGGTIKQCYISRFGTSGVILNVDFSQIELRIAAAWFNEPLMKGVYLRKEDLHMLTASVIAGCSMAEFKKLDKDTQKKWRTRAKRVNFGVLYGGGPPALQATLKKDGVFVTIQECKEFIDKFFKAYPALRAGMDSLEMSVRSKGYLESFTGRRRRVPEVYCSDRQLQARAIRQCINFPIQSGAGDMTLMSLVLINRVLKAEGFRSKIIATVHDSIVFDCHVDEYLAVAKLAKDIMEKIPELSDEVCPGLDWSWLDVPIVAECEVGTSWGQMIEFDPETIELKGESDEALFGPDEKTGKNTLKRKPVNEDELWDAMAFKLETAV